MIGYHIRRDVVIIIFGKWRFEICPSQVCSIFGWTNVRIIAAVIVGGSMFS